MFVGASNQLPEDEALNALLDRFLIRLKCDCVAPDLLEDVLLAGWKLEKIKLKRQAKLRLWRYKAYKKKLDKSI